MFDGDELGQNAHGDLLGRHCADVEADGRVHLPEYIGWHSRREQLVVNPSDLGPAADETEVAQVARRQRPQGFQIVGVAAGHDDHIGVRGQSGSRDPRGDVFRHDLGGVREPFAVGELLAIVDDVHSKADLVRQVGEVEPDVARADHEELRRGLNGLDVDVHLTTTDEAGLLGEVVRQLVVHELRPSVENRLARLAERVVLVAAAADGAHHAAVAEDQHLGADPLRRRSRGRDDGDQRGRFAPVEGIGDGGEHFLVHLRLII